MVMRKTMSITHAESGTENRIDFGPHHSTILFLCMFSMFLNFWSGPVWYGVEWHLIAFSFALSNADGWTGWNKGYGTEPMGFVPLHYLFLDSLCSAEASTTSPGQQQGIYFRGQGSICLRHPRVL